MTDLIEQLAAIVGAQQVLTGADVARWSTDWTGKYKGEPLVVVRPGSREEVAAVLRVASARNLPVVPVSGNTGTVGGAMGKGAIVLTLERMNRIREIRAGARVAVVEAGVVIDALNAAAEEHGLMFPLSFGASGSAMIGGVLSTNAGGANVVRYGNTRDLCLGIEVVLADGRIMDLMQALHKNNSGFDLRHLMIGAEGQLGIITAAVVKLYPCPVDHVTAMVAMPSLDRAPDLLNAIQSASAGAVVAFEFMPRAFIEGHFAVRPDAREPFDAPHPVNLLIELAATKTGVLGEALEEVLAGWLEAGDVTDAVIARNETQRREMWARREAAAEIAYRRRPVVDTDIAVPLDRVSHYLREIEPRLRAIDPDCEVLSVAHLGDGNIHYTCYPSREQEELVAALRTEIDDLALEMNGTFSAEHGVGLSKLAPMARYKDPVALDVMRAIKAALDPKGILNPGKTLPGSETEAAGQAPLTSRLREVL
ncbi:FAD/FMN-containing dehydrogenase [Pseudochelatococcus lubricantis]|uniref:FAD/FMN-containing dehydrogenase n=1 Tax=Pseudochelatococcus lubricantis TaxID=1538102 RepID=A0ABX0V4W6_9HYPH|nr:FAD-binding oxidoreductase [Pseudochelatococcus lubricantis]NIJ59982.1 FAD/FMN-containing dehydrogenase [Pseudochelatococcus lubricantis]